MSQDDFLNCNISPDYNYILETLINSMNLQIENIEKKSRSCQKYLKTSLNETEFQELLNELVITVIDYIRGIKLNIELWKNELTKIQHKLHKVDLENKFNILENKLNNIQHDLKDLRKAS